MSKIHPTAIVSDKAKIGENITIEPYAIIYDDVEIGDNCFVGPSANIYDGARIGNNVKIFQSASVSNVPQDLKFDKEVSYTYIDNDTTIREFATVHRGTGEGGITKIGKNCLLMAYVHVPHDSLIGDNVILANTTQIAGHVEIDSNVIIGGLTAIHQFCKIGRNSMIGASVKITQDIPPFILVGREPSRYMGLNVIGLKRKGFTQEDIDILRKVYGLIYDSGLNLSQAKEKIKSELADQPLAKEVLNFLERSNRGIIRK